MWPQKQNVVKSSTNRKLVKVLKDGTSLVLLDDVYFIETSPNNYRGIDDRFDTEALEIINQDSK